MAFDDQELDLHLSGKRVRVRVKADLLHLLVRIDQGPQSAEGLVITNLALIRSMAATMVARRASDILEIGARDYETGGENALPTGDEADRLNHLMRVLSDAHSKSAQ